MKEIVSDEVHFSNAEKEKFLIKKELLLGCKALENSTNQNMSNKEREDKDDSICCMKKFNIKDKSRKILLLMKMQIFFLDTN